MDKQARSLDQTVLFIGGCLLFLGGLMIGVAGGAKGAPVIGMAHTLGLLEAVFMLAFAAIRPHVNFNILNAWIFVGLTFIAFYCNFIGVCLSVITGASGGQYLPPWNAYLTNDAPVVNNAVAFLLNMSAAAVALPVMLAMAWFSNVKQTLITSISILFTIVMLYFTFHAG